MTLGTKKKSAADPCKPGSAVEDLGTHRLLAQKLN